MALSTWLQSSAVPRRSRGFASLQSGNIIVFSTCMSQSFRYNSSYTQITPLTATWFHLPHRALSLPQTHVNHFSSYQFVFLLTVIKDVWLVKILIFRFLTLLSRLCLLVKRWRRGSSCKAVWKDLENTTKNAKLSEYLQFGCDTASPALEFRWN